MHTFIDRQGRPGKVQNMYALILKQADTASYMSICTQEAHMYALQFVAAEASGGSPAQE